MSKKRPKISIYIATSLDGYIAGEDGNVDFLESVGGYDEDYGFKSFLSSIDTVVMGRKTYDIAYPAYGTALWPYQGKKLVVMSRTLKTVIENASVHSGDLPTLINELYAAGCQHIWIDGGTIISQFLSLDLVDEMTLSIIPVLLGTGIPLFTLNRPHACKLLDSHAYLSGLVQVKYALLS